MKSTLKRLSAFTILTVLATVSIIATAQLTTLGGKKSTARAHATTGPLAGEAPLNRLIIKFKDQATDKTGAFSASLAQGHVKALSAGGAMQSASTGLVELSYLKSITPQSHVALTTQKLGRAELSALAKQLAQDPRVEYAEIDEKVYPLMVPTDTDFATQQWNLKAPGVAVGGANLTPAWDRQTVGLAPINGVGVVVAVLDTGYRPHADLAANILTGYDFISADSAGVFTTARDGDGRDADAQDPGDWVATASTNCPVADSSWHGTHVAGIVAAVGNNGAGVIGVAYGAKILPVRVLGVCGGYTSDIAAGIRWAAGLAVSGVSNNLNVAKVINLSLGSSGICSSTFQTAITAARAAGSVIVTATGNDGALSIGQPANCNGVIAVTAHTRLGDNADYANVGAGTTISAPGGGYGTNIAGDGSSIYSTANAGLTTPASDNYTSEAGTSFAVPHVAGVVALMFQAKPGITPDEVQSRLVTSARAHPAGTYCVGIAACGAGLLDADAAVALTLDATVPITTASTAPANPVLRGATVSLTGVATPGASAISSVVWTQLSGPAVTITNAATSNASFVASSGAASYVFRFRATDGLGHTSDSWVSVLTSNTAPVLNTISAQTVVVGHSLNFTVSATDTDGDVVTYSASGLPSGATFNTVTGAFSWSNAQPAGSYSFFIAPSDGAAYGAAQTVTVTVTAAAVAVATSSGGGAADWTDLLAVLLLAFMALAFRRRTPAPR
ncbi:MAG: hypothetical protein RIS34_1855 [Pseudomonadota bacterium]|jgi:serine protease